MRTHLVRIVTAAAAALAGVIAIQAWAQSPPLYPVRAIRILVPNPPGGATDTTARLLAQKLGSLLGQPVLAENRPGSNGNIAGELAARAAPDGYTLLLGADAQIVISPHLYAKMTFDTLKDLVPISSILSSQMVLSVNPSVPAKNLQEFVEYARRANPPLAYASIGNGSQHHLVMEMLKSAAGIKLVHVPYKGGGPATVALLAGEVSAMLGGNSTAGQIKSGRLRALALTGKKRSTLYPELPNLVELYPGVEATIWLGLFAPAGLPAPVLARLRAETHKVLADSDVREKFHNSGEQEPLATTPEEFAALIRADYAKYGAIVKAVGATID